MPVPRRIGTVLRGQHARGPAPGSSIHGVARLARTGACTSARPIHAGRAAGKRVVRLRLGPAQRFPARVVLDRLVLARILGLSPMRARLGGARRALRLSASATASPDRRGLGAGGEAVGGEVLEPLRDGVVIDPCVPRGVRIVQLAEQYVAQGTRGGDERQDGRRGRGADHRVEVMLASRAGVHMVGERRAESGGQSAGPAEGQLGELGAVLARSLCDSHGGERALEFAPGVRQYAEALRPGRTDESGGDRPLPVSGPAARGRATRLPEAEHEAETLAVQSVTDGQLEDLPVSRGEPFRLRPLQRVELGAPQIPLQRGQRAVRVRRTTGRSQPPGDRRRRGGTRRLDAQLALVPHERVQPRMNVFGRPKLRDVPIGHHERAVERVHRRIVVPQ